MLRPPLAGFASQVPAPRQGRGFPKPEPQQILVQKASRPLVCCNFPDGGKGGENISYLPIHEGIKWNSHFGTNKLPKEQSTR